MKRKIWVSGATGNMGKAVIQKFLSADDQVMATILPGEKRPVWPEKQPELTELNLQDEKAVADSIEVYLQKNSTIDIAVLTVGGFALGNLEATSSDSIYKMLNLNFVTAFNCAKPLFLQMKKQGFGRIFLIGARPGLNMKDSKGVFAYGLSKSMIFRLAELLNEEAKGTEVVVNVVVPSTIDTPQNRSAMPDADPDLWVKAEEIAEIIHFYSSEAARAIREPIIKIYNRS